jgi:hypothetical protein
MDEIVKKRFTFPKKRLPNICPLAQVDQSAQLLDFHPEFSIEPVYCFEQCHNIIASFGQKSHKL